MLVSYRWLGRHVDLSGIDPQALADDLTCFVVHNTLQDSSISISEIFKGAIPFAFVMLLVLILVAVVPEVALLPLQILR
jgi:TRAP-type mannitol/chloroaromatic compound transport system permease large subunit